MPVAPAGYLARKSSSISREEAAVASMAGADRAADTTRLTRNEPGQRVLVHAASRGDGMGEVAKLLAAGAIRPRIAKTFRCPSWGKHTRCSKPGEQSARSC
ncbi:hypothetical protein JDN40_06910 [Rhodomicrobium vannielii ATCC 17100]|uniref:hypothetical protein n=1 Tax=Rhodomicrobium vannielii TaxID=1069 RepID=UPI00191829D3|nr:hypothetical protein [Rhodomicrobium vannielii]MBJ7533829.1 hypothetical protein [Rhodomicrobium vannielii ATCC 17100]